MHFRLVLHLIPALNAPLCHPPASCAWVFSSGYIFLIFASSAFHVISTSFLCVRSAEGDNVQPPIATDGGNAST